MRKLTTFNFISLNGFFKGPDEDISWHKHGEEESKYSEEMLALNNILLFGRKTYEQMFSFWPGQFAKEMFPEVAEGMNRAEKIVFSNSLPDEEIWENTRFIGGDIIEKIKQIKQSPGKDLTILGSGSIVTLFAEHQLIDEFQIMIDPVVLAEGVPLFDGLKNKLEMELTRVKSFSSGTVLLYYKPY